MVSWKHKFHSPKGDGPDTSLIRPSNWNDDHDGITDAAGVVLGRNPTSPGDLEELPLSLTASGRMQASGSEGFTPPAGTTLTRPASPRLGEIRFNTTTNFLECWDGAHWSFVPVVQSQTATGVIEHVDFIDIPSTVNSLRFDFNLTMALTADICLQFYDGAGVLDGALHYYASTMASTGTVVVPGGSGNVGVIHMGQFGPIFPIVGSISIPGIQRAARTEISGTLHGVDPTGTIAVTVANGGGRTVNGPITGVRITSDVVGAFLTGIVSMMQLP